MGSTEMQKRFLTVGRLLSQPPSSGDGALERAAGGAVAEGAGADGEAVPGHDVRRHAAEAGVEGRSWRVARSYDSGVVRQVGEGTKPSGAVWASTGPSAPARLASPTR